MNTLFFKYALEVARTHSITHAAENLFIAQPNLSKAIKEAENSLGYKIFTRTSKGVVPTQKGMLFLELSKKIMAQLDEMNDIAHTVAENNQRMHISIPNSNFISDELISFINSLDASDSIDLRIKETDSMQAIKDVAVGESDFGIVRHKVLYEKYFDDYIAEKKITSDVLCKYSYFILLSSEHQLSDRQFLKPADLQNLIQILHNETFIPYLGRNKEAPEVDTDKCIRIYERATRFEILSSVPNTFMISAPMPRTILKRYNLAQIQYASPTNIYKKLLVYQKGYRFTELERRFTDYVRQYIDKPEIQNIQ